MSSYLFEGTSPKKWKQKIQVDLKGADYNTLLWHTNEKIIVKPFYTKEDRTHQQINIPQNDFCVCQSFFIDNEEITNSLANNALKHGATSIYFHTKNTFNYKKVLKNIDINSTKIYFNFSFLNPDFIAELSNFCNSKNIYFNIDIIGNLAKTGNWFVNLKDDHKNLEKIISTTNNCIGVNLSIYQNSGANIVQQLAYTLAHANEYLNYFGKEASNEIHFYFSAGNNYFFEIAKLRAFRILWSSLLKIYEAKNTPAHIFAEPTLRNKTLYNNNINKLRTTTECMSCILGGADTISNNAYNKIFRKSNEFSERISRNQLLILKDECEISSNKNIVDGSYYIEEITQQLAEKALEIFKLIEKGGGLLKQLKEGVIQRKIQESADKEQHQFNSEELVLIGTNKHQNKFEKIKDDLELYPFVKIRAKKTLIQPIIQRRLSEKLEQERLKNE
ncbi:MAG: methylmalonyl-CoA mutase subunit beta [Tenacibaculum sp.]|nr:methylmalonyl-CoA mutase subunit beta [Tenacibaculum sp.]